MRKLYESPRKESIYLVKNENSKLISKQVSKSEVNYLKLAQSKHVIPLVDTYERDG